MSEKKKRGFSIRSKLVLAYFLLVLIPLGGLGTALLIQQHDRTMISTRDSINSNSSLQWSALKSKINGVQDTMALLSNDLGNNKMLVDNLPLLASPDTYERGLLGEHGNDGVAAAISGDESATSTTNGSLIKTFNYTLTSDTNLKGVRLYTEYLSSSLSNCIFPVYTNSNEAEAYEKCRLYNASTFWLMKDESLYAYHSVLSYSEQTLPMVAMLRFQIDLGQFLSGFDSVYLGNAYLLIDSDGDAIGFRSLGVEDKDMAYLKAIQNRDLGEKDFNSTIGVVSFDEDTGWYLAYYIDSNQILGQLYVGVATVLGIVFGAFALTTIIAILLVNAFTKRISRLKEGADRVAKGDYDTIIQDNSGDELSELAASFNIMEGEVKKTLQDMIATQDGISQSFAEILESKSGQSGHHVKRVCEFTGILAEEMGFNEEDVHDIKVASMLHDVGKILIPNAILDKPGKLTDEEYAVMKMHVTYGEQILQNSPGVIMQIAAKIAGCHHERWDGRGYMKGLKGDEIPIEAQIASVADVFDALSSIRSYKPRWSFEDCYNEIVKNSGTQFSPRVVEAFIARFEDFKKIAEQYRDN